MGRIIDKLIWADKQKRRIFLVIAILGLFATTFRDVPTKFLAIYQFVHYFPFYFIGMIISRTDLSRYELYHNKIMLVIICLVIAFSFQQEYLSHRFITQTLGLAIILAVFVYARTSSINNIPIWAKSLDRCSMGIYIVHHVLLQEMNVMAYFHGEMTNHYYLYPVLQFVVLAFVSWAFVAGFKKFTVAKYILG